MRDYRKICESVGLHNAYKVIDESLMDDFDQIGFALNEQYTWLDMNTISVFPEYLNEEVFSLLNQKCEQIYQYEE